MAPATLSCVRPPERMSGVPPRRRAVSIDQSSVSPVPPRRPSTWASTRWKSVWKTRSAWRSPRLAIRAALTTRAPVRRATSSQKAGPSSPCSCTRLSRARSAVRATVSSGALTNTPASSTRRRSSAPISSAAGTVQRRLEPGQKIMPSAQAPASAHSSASSSEVMPQSLIRGGCTPGRLDGRFHLGGSVRAPRPGRAVGPPGCGPHPRGRGRA